LYLELLNDATDYAEAFEITSLAKEKGGLRIGTSQGYILLLGPFTELAEAIIELLDHSDLPELRRPQRVHSMQELLDELSQGQHPS
jgi:hypothetical protein